MSTFLISICQGVAFFVFLAALVGVPGLLCLYLLWRFNRRAFWKLRF